MSKMSDEEESPVQAKCKWFNASKGYGFIVTPSGEEVFVHHTNIKQHRYRVLYAGEPVEFRRRISSSGRPEAYAVTGPGGRSCSGTLEPPQAREYRCYNCGLFAGHLANECPKPQQDRISCFRCGSLEHRRAQCPEVIAEKAAKAAAAAAADSGVDMDTSNGSEAATSSSAGNESTSAAPQ